MKHVCKMNTVVLKSFNDRLKIATVSALSAIFAAVFVANAFALVKRALVANVIGAIMPCIALITPPALITNSPSLTTFHAAKNAITTAVIASIVPVFSKHHATTSDNACANASKTGFA